MQSWTVQTRLLTLASAQDKGEIMSLEKVDSVTFKETETKSVTTELMGTLDGLISRRKGIIGSINKLSEELLELDIRIIDVKALGVITSAERQKNEDDKVIETPTPEIPV